MTEPTTEDTANPENDEIPPIDNEKVFTSPITNARSRITKKPFGIYVTPGNSPIEGERFTGYHNAVDFEAPESGTVNIYAICDGEVRVARWVSGYGGLIIQACELSEEPITVLYGHVDIASPASLKVGDNAKGGEAITTLAEVGRYTDGERKHLHLGIHRGKEIVYAGYVEQQSQLSNWVNLEDYL
ncbi:MAG: M23 family metallopeptidase [Patescibacteria group bacterium]|nr:M23 family metallopeptidase [Patescibacteria group bacterium]